ncbi:MAG: efflux RND transporter periplasmic adaptor subunit [Gammaproteobacteria bacterium]|nr:efflux RND transporter periplasmic adaptor subunit [Gammaproteobacteria bacterium]
MKILFSVLLAIFLFNSALAQENHTSHQHKDITHRVNEDHDQGHDATLELNTKLQVSDHEHKPNDKHEHEDTHEITLSETQVSMANIRLLQLKEESIKEKLLVPGEVIVNAHRTSSIVSRVNAQLLKQHAQLGEQVQAQQVLLTLSSLEMAAAQADLLSANIELQQVTELGSAIVSNKRYSQASINYQRALSKVVAFGMHSREIEQLLKNNTASLANGEFQLVAAQNGIVITMDFIIGQMVSPGHEMIRITDESKLWVEARLPSSHRSFLNIGAATEVTIRQEKYLGSIVQIQHQLDAITRTQPIIAEIDNSAHRLHPGQFVNVSIETERSLSGIIVPIEAVLRNSQGRWQVYVKDSNGRFAAKEVDLIKQIGQQVLISGVAPNQHIAAEGAFFIQSELAKSAFDVHNH